MGAKPLPARTVAPTSTHAPLDSVHGLVSEAALRPLSIEAASEWARYETSYERVTTIEYNSTYMNVVFSTTQASLVDGFYQWILKCQDDELYFYHRKVARINFNTAKILHLTVPKLDDDVETLNEFLGANNAENTQYMVDGLHAIIQGEAPCAVDHCWWQGLGPGPGPPTP